MYLKCDILLLADAFEKFRISSLKNYGMCRSLYFSALVLRWHSVFNSPVVEIEPISDAHLHLLFEKV